MLALICVLAAETALKKMVSVAPSVTTCFAKRAIPRFMTPCTIAPYAVTFDFPCRIQMNF